VCVFSPAKDHYTETFIHAHMERLPASVVSLHGSPFPTFTMDGDPMLPWLQAKVNRICAWLVGVAPSRLDYSVVQHYPHAIRKGILRNFLKKHRVRAVLAEYGPAGVSIMDSCRDAGVRRTG